MIGETVPGTARCKGLAVAGSDSARCYHSTRCAGRTGERESVLWWSILGRRSHRSPRESFNDALKYVCPRFETHVNVPPTFRTVYRRRSHSGVIPLFPADKILRRFLGFFLFFFFFSLHTLFVFVVLFFSCLPSFKIASSVSFYGFTATPTGASHTVGRREVIRIQQVGYTRTRDPLYS